MTSWWRRLCPLDKFLIRWYAVGTVYTLAGMSTGEDWMLTIGSGTLFMASMLITFQKAVWDDKSHDHEKEDRRVQEPQTD